MFFVGKKEKHPIPKDPACLSSYLAPSVSALSSISYVVASSTILFISHGCPPICTTIIASVLEFINGPINSARSSLGSIPQNKVLLMLIALTLAPK